MALQLGNAAHVLAEKRHASYSEGQDTLSCFPWQKRYLHMNLVSESYSKPQVVGERSLNFVKVGRPKGWNIAIYNNLHAYTLLI